MHCYPVVLGYMSVLVTCFGQLFLCVISICMKDRAGFVLHRLLLLLAVSCYKHRLTVLHVSCI